MRTSEVDSAESGFVAHCEDVQALRLLANGLLLAKFSLQLGLLGSYRSVFLK